MGQVSVTVNNRSYTVACDDGQEDHVTELAQYIDSHVQELAGTVGQVGDARLLLMASLLVADELAEMVNRVETIESEMEDLKQTQDDTSRKTSALEGRLADVVERASKRLEELAERVEGAAG